VGGKRRLTIEAARASRLGRYIQSATLDGRPFERAWLPSRQLHAGGKLSFVMGPTPNKSWATGADAAPPGPTFR
jgi:putative alpha-1,2-mannosidase